MIQDHATSLDLSKQLHEAGIKIKSEFWWIGIKGENAELARKGDDPHADFILGNKRKLKKFVPDGFCYPAPLSSELGELLKGESIQFGNLSEGWIVNWTNFSGQTASIRELHLQDAMAKMLLYLKGKGIL